ncbi:MAG: fatty acid CoA ligase family protein [Planctomycetota bacterium]|nr:fatty acid CoA ligase family protein [Planctomycetota bacterium]
MCSASDKAAVESSDLINVAGQLSRMAREHPDVPAIVWRSRAGTYTRVTFVELNAEVDRYAHGLSAAEVVRGTRTIVMVRPKYEFFVLTFALLKIGAVPALIDPGMGWRNVVACLSGIQAEAFIGIPLAQVLRVLNRRAFRSVRTVVTVGRRWCWGGLRMEDVRSASAEPFEAVRSQADDPAAILFTSGSTGPAKGVLYRHGMFAAQVRILREHFGVQPGEVDLPTFPLFALFDPALGMTAVLPEMDPTRPASVDPEKIVSAIRDQGVTHTFGSPALLNRVGRYVADNGVKLPTLRRVISAGAPVPPIVLERFAKALDGDARIYTPYGATEALPVASIDHREILGETAAQSARGAGTCVGRPVSEMDVRIIRISDDPIVEWFDDLEMPAGEIGEIVVKGPVVTREYYAAPRATELAKIRDGDSVWHRMGDVGRFDGQGRLWFCGRKAHRVETEFGTSFSVPCEAIFNQHPRVFRSALVGVGKRPRQRPVMCIELESGEEHPDQNTLCEELSERARSNPLTQHIKTILIHPSFPVDIRHNAKIFREKLAVWATEQIR